MGLEGAEGFAVVKFDGEDDVGILGVMPESDAHLRAHRFNELMDGTRFHARALPITIQFSGQCPSPPSDQPRHKSAWC